jgi:hypothetical protein
MGFVLTGCAGVQDLDKTQPSLEGRSSKDPNDYIECLMADLSIDQSSIVIEKSGGRIKAMVPQGYAAKTPALVTADRTSHGTKVTLRDGKANIPFSFAGIRSSVSQCL